MTQPSPPLPSSSHLPERAHQAIRMSSALILRLIRGGVLRDHHWRDALEAHPRHAFLRGFYAAADPPRPWRHVDADAPGFLPAVHSGQALVVAISPLNTWGHQHPVSVSPPTDLQISSLQALELFDGADVLEVGTGTGHTTALLCHRLGPRHVTSIDIDPDLHRQATRNLHVRDLHPRLLLGDSADPPLSPASLTPGRRGGPAAQYDRVLVAHETPTVPPTWIRLLRPDGTLLARISGGLGAGGHALLHRSPAGEPSVSGRFLPWTGDLSPHRAPARTLATAPQPEHDPAPPAVWSARSGSTPHPPDALTTAGAVALLAQLVLPPGTRAWRRATGDPNHATTGWATYLHAPDGSWAEITHHPDRRGRHDTRWAGPTPLLPAITRAHTVHHDLGAPTMTDFGVSSDPAGTVVWHQNPSTGNRWPVTR